MAGQVVVHERASQQCIAVAPLIKDGVVARKKNATSCEKSRLENVSFC